MGFKFSFFEEWAKTYHTEQMQILHVETGRQNILVCIGSFLHTCIDHAESYVRRFALGILEWARTVILQKVYTKKFDYFYYMI